MGEIRNTSFPHSWCEYRTAVHPQRGPQHLQGQPIRPPTWARHSQKQTQTMNYEFETLKDFCWVCVMQRTIIHAIHAAFSLHEFAIFSQEERGIMQKIFSTFVRWRSRHLQTFWFLTCFIHGTVFHYSPPAPDHVQRAPKSSRGEHDLTIHA